MNKAVLRAGHAPMSTMYPVVLAADDETAASKPAIRHIDRVSLLYTYGLAYNRYTFHRFFPSVLFRERATETAL